MQYDAGNETGAGERQSIQGIDKVSKSYSDWPPSHGRGAPDGMPAGQVD